MYLEYFIHYVVINLLGGYMRHKNIIGSMVRTIDMCYSCKTSGNISGQTTLVLCSTLNLPLMFPVGSEQLFLKFMTGLLFTDLREQHHLI